MRNIATVGRRHCRAETGDRRVQSSGPDVSDQDAPNRHQIHLSNDLMTNGLCRTDALAHCVHPRERPGAIKSRRQIRAKQGEPRMNDTLFGISEDVGGR